MTGILGIISSEDPEACKAQLKSMVFSFDRESCYNLGTYSDENIGVYLGWCCHKGSSIDCMPIINEKSDLSLFLTGEVIPDRGEIDDLKKLGHKIQSPDNSYLIHQFEERGTLLFKNLNGLFSGVLINKKQQCCYVFNDRYGMKRLFIHKGKDGFYFASRAKALLSVLPETRDFDDQGLADFITCGCTIGNRTLYKNIEIFPAGSFWVFRKGLVAEKVNYFSREEWECQERLEPERFAIEVLDVFPEVVRQYATARTPIGISLTGGFDSRMLMACLETTPGKYPCYTFGSMYRETFDVKIAREVARECKQDHTELVLGQEFLRDFPLYLEGAVSRSDGYIGLSGAAELYLNKLARNIAPIRLTGNYGSELLRGARAFKSKLPMPGLLINEFQPLFKVAHNRFKILEKSDPFSFALFHQAPFQGYGRLSIEQSQVIQRTPFLDNVLVKLIYQRPVGHFDGTELSTSIIERCKPDLLRILTDRGDLGTNRYIKKKIMHLYSEALFKGEYLVNHGMPNLVASISGRMPWVNPEKILLGRHKFQHYRRWICNELSDYVRDCLSSNSMLQVPIEKKYIDKMINSHIRGRGNYVDEIDKALTLVLSARLFFKQAY
jgi:asparagine synthase (glutamine-hydrolysing)